MKLAGGRRLDLLSHRKEVIVISAMRATKNFRAGHRCALGPERRSGLGMETSARGLLAGRGAQEEGGGGLNKGEAVDTISRLKVSWR